MEHDFALQLNRLRSTLGKMQVALNAVDNAIIWTGKDTKVQWCNAAFDKLVNRPHILVLGEKLSDLLPLRQAGQPVAPDFYPDVRALGGEYKITEYEFPQGVDAERLVPRRFLILEISGNCVELTSGDKSAVLVIRDVTQAKRVEAERQRTNEALQQLSAAIQASVDGISILNSNQTHVYLNESYAKLYGYKNAQELIGKSWKVLYDEAELHQFEQEVMPKFSLRGQWRGEVIGTRRDGSKFPQELSLTAIQDGGWICVVRDISVRKKAEAALRRSEVKFRNIFENSQVGILRTTRFKDGLILEANQRLIELTGYSCAADVIGKRFTTEFYANLDDRQRLLTELRQNGKVNNFEMQFRQRDGTLKWGLFSVHPNFEETCLEVVVIDISDRKQAEAELKLAVQQLQQEITERQRVEAALKDSEERFQLAVYGTFDGIWDWDLRTNQVFLSPIYAGTLGYSEGELPQELSTWSNNVHPDDLPVARKAVQDHLDGETPIYTCVFRMKHKDGHWLWIEAKGICIRDELGNPYRMTGTQRNISNRKRAEAALRQREQEFRTLVENAPDVIIRFDRESRYLYINSRVEHDTGMPPAAFIGKTTQEVGFPEVLVSLWQTTIEQVFATAEEQEFEFELPSLEKVTHYFSRVVPEFGSNGSVESVLVICRDTTERKQAEAALQRRAQVESLLSSISRHFIDQDVDTAINFTLQAIAQFIGAEQSCMFGLLDQRYGYLIHEWGAEGIEPIPSEAGSGYLNEFPLFNQLLSGNAFQIPCVTELSPNLPERMLFESMSIQSVVVVPMIHSGKVVGYIGADTVHFSRTWSQEDISLLQLVGELIAIGQARHKAEEALREAKEAAEVANRAKSQFLSNMSHELRTPLNAILGFAQLMTRNGSLNSQQQGYLDIISRSGEHLLNLINDVLEVSKIEAGRTTLNENNFELHNLLDWLQQMLRLKAESKGLQLIFDTVTDLPHHVRTDESKLRQVLMNLLGNAIKFTQAGSVTLRVRGGLGELGENSSYCLHFAVEDTGPGIAATELESLFQPFVQTEAGRNSQEGTGLGLPISQKFVRLMGGEITVDSRLGEGAVFKFDIQTSAVEQEELHAQESSRRVVGLEAGQPIYRILIVEDKLENRQLLVELLTPIGFEVREALDGQAAIALWQSWSPHLIWMDMCMPVMDGYEATKQIKAAGDRPPVIIALTGSAFEEDRITTLAAGCDDFVRKPFRTEVIFEKMALHLGVRYLYDLPQLRSGGTENSSLPQSILQLDELREALAVMPIDWVEQLHQAATKVNAKQIQNLLPQIPKVNADLANGLTHLVNNFCFEEIVTLTEQQQAKCE